MGWVMLCNFKYCHQTKALVIARIPEGSMQMVLATVKCHLIQHDGLCREYFPLSKLPTWISIFFSNSMLHYYLCYQYVILKIIFVNLSIICSTRFPCKLIVISYIQEFVHNWISSCIK